MSNISANYAKIGAYNDCSAETNVPDLPPTPFPDVDFDSPVVLPTKPSYIVEIDEAEDEEIITNMRAFQKARKEITLKYREELDKIEHLYSILAENTSRRFDDKRKRAEFNSKCKKPCNNSIRSIVD